ncbi:MAG: GTP-binding protein, partial [Spirochaetaceae bacterium]|nr:GTP-binding protein [Spirochaetaceae bacterium]
TDLTRAEAAREITGAKTGDARKRAAERLAGSLFAEIDAVKALLVRTRAALEAEFEYPEDEEAVAAAFDPADLRQAEQRLAALAASWAAEKLYQEGTRVVLAGKTNAGKSSLFNALLKEDRAIVAESAGTTRDYLESWASFQGIPVRLFDTAGLRDAADPVEAAGVARTEELLAGAEVIVYLMDWTLGADDGDRAFLSAKHDAPVIAVWNKTDVPSTPSASHNTPCGALGNALRLSARTGTGIPGLAHAVVHALGALPAGAGGQRASLGSERQKDAADGALAAVRHALQAAGQDFPLDAVAEDIDEALVCLGEITGEVTTDDILDAVFSKFCLGK